MFQGTSHGRLRCGRRGRKLPGDAPNPSDPGRNGVPGGFQKNYWPGAELPDDTNVIAVAPGEAPQPLTLNHSASNPGCSSNRGSLLSTSVSFGADD
jgi:hypothetical protein